MFQDLTKYINFKNSLFQFSLFLCIFGITAITDLLLPTTNPAERMEYIFKLFLTFITGGVVYFMIRYGFGLTITNPSNFLVSTWIVYLLIHPTNIVWYFPLSVIMIAVGKLLFRRMKQPIFNPAAFAITLTYILSKIVNLINPNVDTLLVSWWGADMFQNITKDIAIVNVVIPVVFLLLFLYFANSFKKANYIFAFLISYLASTFIYLYLTASVDSAINFVSLALFNSTAFCALVMIPEPKTSPNFPKQQIIAGIISGLGLLVFNTILSAYPIDPLINTVLLANIITLYFKISAQKPKTPVAPLQPTPAIQPQMPVNQNIQNIA